MARLLTDEHVPGPFVTVLRSLGHDAVRAKDRLEGGSADQRLLETRTTTIESSSPAIGGSPSSTGR